MSTITVDEELHKLVNATAILTDDIKAQVAHFWKNAPLNPRDRYKAFISFCHPFSQGEKNEIAKISQNELLHMNNQLYRMSHMEEMEYGSGRR